MLLLNENFIENGMKTKAMFQKEQNREENDFFLSLVFVAEALLSTFQPTDVSRRLHPQ